MAENLAYVRKAVADGFMTASELNSVRAADSSVNQRLLELEKQADRQRLDLLRLLGLPADSRIRLSKVFRLPSGIVLPKMSLMDGLEQRRLDLLALRRGYDSREAALRAAVLEQFPRITVGPTISRDTDNIRTTGFGINIEMPIFNRGQGKIAVDRATRKKLYDEYINRVFEARSDIERIESGIRFLNEQIAAAQTAEADLGRLVESYRRALADGRTDALVYYATWNDLIEARTKLVGLKGQLARAAVALELATGFYEIPGPDRSQEAVPTESGVREKTMKHKYLITLVLVVAIIGFGAYALWRIDSRGTVTEDTARRFLPRPRSLIATAPPARRTFTLQVPWIGTVESQASVELTALMAGRVESHRGRGSTSDQKGQSVMRLGGPQIEDARARLTAEIQSLETQVRACPGHTGTARRKPQDPVGDQGSGGRGAGGEGQAGGAIGRSTVESENLDEQSRITAPMSGIFTNRRVSVGQEVAAGQVLGEIIDTARLRVAASLFPPQGIRASRQGGDHSLERKPDRDRHCPADSATGFQHGRGDGLD